MQIQPKEIVYNISVSTLHNRKKTNRRKGKKRNTTNNWQGYHRRIEPISVDPTQVITKVVTSNI